MQKRAQYKNIKIKDRKKEKKFIIFCKFFLLGWNYTTRCI